MDTLSFMHYLEIHRCGIASTVHILLERHLCVVPLMCSPRLAEESFSLCTVWSVNRCFANGGWCVGIIVGDTDTNTGLTQEAVIFQRYFVLKRSPLPVTGSCIFHQLNSHLTLEMHLSSAVQGGSIHWCTMLFPAPSCHSSP